ncbi:MAG: pseudouridine synthase [Clostridia bacterium]
MNTDRLQKYVSDCGLMSRRAAEKEILNGFFTINGEIAKIGEKIDPKADIVKYKGVRVRGGAHKLYIMLNKPAGYVTTASDDLGRQNVCELVTSLGTRVYPVGRLDKSSEGLLILTNDGDFAEHIMHPKYHFKKKYIVTTNGLCDNNALDMLRAMRELEKEPILPVEINLLERNERYSKILFILSEGKNRQIRRMCSEVGLQIMQLKRLSVGNVSLGNLETGNFRHLTREEIKELSE